MKNRYKVLVIEDEVHINNLLCALMDANGYQALSALSCEEGNLMFASHRPDLVILDLGLPDQDGMQFLEEIRKDSLVPIIVLSARTDEKDKVLALNAGANDYVTKPFGSKELVARVGSALRTASHRAENGMRTIDGEEIRLTQTEYNIVALLSEHAGKMLTYDTIIAEIWGYQDAGSTKKLQVNMANIRKKLGAQPGKQNYIINELGVGYRMSEGDD